MKTLVRYSTVLVGALLSLTSATSPAQVATTSAQSGTGGQPPDSVVQIAADSQNLTPVAAAQIPDLGSGTFWVFDGQAPMPMPFLPPQCDPASTPVYSFGFNSEYLVDLTSGAVPQPTAGQTSASSLVQGQLNDVLGLIALVQQEQANAALNATPGGAMLAAAQGGAQFQASAAMFSSAGSISPTGLFLQITNVSAATVSADLYNASDQVYAIWSTTNLATPFGAWQVETEVWPTNANCMPFTVLTQGRQNLFLYAEDWTGVTENDNTTPDWWFWEYFGTTALLDSDLDSQGNTLLSDYLTGTDPNLINFSLVVTNNYVNTASPQVDLNLMAGSPAYYAVSVDDTNYAADANWQTYTGTNITVPLGSAAGWHSVWVGLKGPAPDATVTWQWDRLNLDVPPVLVVTNPASSTVTVPVIQLQGYCQEPLASISYDLANAAGTVTGQQVLVLDQSYDTNYWVFTTNTFQAFDIPLTNGLNVITLHATDLAGNTTTANYNFTLDYSSKTNPPLVQVNWPQDGVEVCGNSFTCNGTVSDPTATVTVQMVDTNNDTNIVTAAVGRDGSFWAEGLPLSSGPNYLTLTAMDVVGNVTTINLTVVQGDLGLAIDPVSAGQTTVTGEINDSGNYTIWVNGVQGMENGNGTWTAQIAAIGVGGGVVEAMAIPNSDNGGYGSGVLDPAGNPLGSATLAQSDAAFSAQDDSSQSQSSQGAQGLVRSPQGVYIAMYKDHQDCEYTLQCAGTNCMQLPPQHDYLDWRDGSSGNEDVFYVYDFPDFDGAYFTIQSDTVWPTNYWPQSLPAGTNTEILWFYNTSTSPWGATNIYTADAPRQAMERCNMDGQQGIGNGAFEFYQRHADCQVKLATGGPPGSTAMNLWVISANATEYDPPWESPYHDYIDFNTWSGSSSAPITPSNITINGKQVGSGGVVYLTLQDNADPDITPIISGAPKYYTFSISAQKYTPVITDNGTPLDPDQSLVTNCVGQNVTFALSWTPQSPPSVLANQTTYIWTPAGTYVNHSWQLQTFYIGYGSVNYDIDTSLLNGPAPYVFYLPDGQGNTHVQKQVYTHAFLHFSNGQSATVNASGIFTIYTPEVAMLDPHHHGMPTVIWERPWSSSQGGAIQLGVPSTTNNMNYQLRVTSSDFNGGAEIIQLCTLNSTGLGGICSGCLDGSDAYTSQTIDKTPNPTGRQNILELDDAPDALVSIASITLNDSFVDYVMFDPDLGASNFNQPITSSTAGIYVPIALVTWSAYGWVIYPDTEISQGNGGGPQGPTPNNQFPQWTCTH